MVYHASVNCLSELKIIMARCYHAVIVKELGVVE